MSNSKEFVAYVCDQLSGAGEITSKPMFGEHGLYCDGKFFALICDDQLFVKITKAGSEILPGLETAPPYPNAKPYFLIHDLDDRELLAQFVLHTCAELPFPKPRKRKTKK